MPLEALPAMPGPAQQLVRVALVRVRARARVVPVLALVAASAPSTASAMAVQPTWSGCGPRQESRCAAVGCPLAAAAPCEAQPKTGEGRERRVRRGRLEMALAAALAQPKQQGR